MWKIVLTFLLLSPFSAKASDFANPFDRETQRCVFILVAEEMGIPAITEDFKPPPVRRVEDIPKSELRLMQKELEWSDEIIGARINFFHPPTRTVVLVSEIFPRRPLQGLAHEMTHYLQLAQEKNGFARFKEIARDVSGDDRLETEASIIGMAVGERLAKENTADYCPMTAI